MVAGIILSPCKQQLLLSRRLKHAHQGGLWEFPGGKLEADEAPSSALARELAEELGIQVLQSQPYMAVSHDYSDKLIYLDTWLVDVFEGEAQGREGQEIRWVAIDELASLPFPEADRPILDALQNRSA